MKTYNMKDVQRFKDGKVISTPCDIEVNVPDLLRDLSLALNYHHILSIAIKNMASTLGMPLESLDAELKLKLENKDA